MAALHRGARAAARVGPAAGRGQDRPARRRGRRDRRVPRGRLRRARRRPTSTPCTSRRSTAAPAPTRSPRCIVIEEVARGCASSSLIPAVNKLGTTGILLAGSEELKQRYLPEVASGDGDVLVRAVRAGRRQRRRGDDDAGGARRRRLGAQRREAVDHQRRRLPLLHGDGGHRPGRGQPRDLRVRRARRRPGLHARRARAQARHQGLADPRGLLRRRAASRPTA